MLSPEVPLGVNVWCSVGQLGTQHCNCRWCRYVIKEQLGLTAGLQREEALSAQMLVKPTSFQLVTTEALFVSILYSCLKLQTQRDQSPTNLWQFNFWGCSKTEWCLVTHLLHIKQQSSNLEKIVKCHNKMFTHGQGGKVAVSIKFKCDNVQ